MKSSFIYKVFCGVAFASLLFVVSCSKDKNVSVGFYNLDSHVVEGIKSVIDSHYAEQKLNFTYIQFSDDNLESQLKSSKIDLFFAPDGYSTKTIVKSANEKAGIPSSVLGNVTTSIQRKAIVSENLVKAVPVLSDNIEVDVEIPSFQESKIKGIGSLKDIQKFGEQQKKFVDYPIVFAGDEPVFFFDFLGALCEACDGQKYYEEAVKILEEAAASEKKFNAKEVAEQLTEKNSSPMLKTKDFLRQLYNKKLFSNEVFNYKIHDVQAFSAARSSKILFMSFTDHRNFDQNVISRYESSFIPSLTPKNVRFFSSSTLYAIPVTSNPNVSKIAQDFVSVDFQESLCRSTGLAPVLRNCRTTDVQASDVRFWIASSSTPNAGLGHETSLTKEQLRQIKNELKANIIY